jgi:hypothetical protein
MIVPLKDPTENTDMFRFVSKGVQQAWRLKEKQVNVAAMRTQYLRCVEEGLPAGTCGAFFEQFILATLLQPASVPLELFDVVPLAAKGGATPKKSSESVSVGLECVSFSGADASGVKKVAKTTIFQPTNQQFPFVDFLIVYADETVTGIQSTVSKSEHRPTPSTFSKVFDPLTKNKLKLTKIVWAVPKTTGLVKFQDLDDKLGTLAPNAKLRTEYNKIPQYLLML